MPLQNNIFKQPNALLTKPVIEESEALQKSPLT
jgi:hypothetical protein